MFSGTLTTLSALMDIDISRNEMVESTAGKVLTRFTQRDLGDRLAVKSYALRLLSLWKQKFTHPNSKEAPAELAGGATAVARSPHRSSSSGSSSSSDASKAGRHPSKRRYGSASVALLQTPDAKRRP